MIDSINPLSYDTAISQANFAKTESFASINSHNFEKAKETAQNFESFFLAQTMQTMFEGIETDGIFGGGQAEKICRSMLIDQYGKILAKRGGVGIASQVMDFIIKTQEVETQKNTEDAKP